MTMTYSIIYIIYDLVFVRWSYIFPRTPVLRLRYVRHCLAFPTRIDCLGDLKPSWWRYTTGYALLVNYRHKYVDTHNACKSPMCNGDAKNDNNVRWAKHAKARPTRRVSITARLLVNWRVSKRESKLLQWLWWNHSEKIIIQEGNGGTKIEA